MSYSLQIGRIITTIFFCTFCAFVRSDAIANPRDVVAVVGISSCISEMPLNVCKESVRLVVESAELGLERPPRLFGPFD